MEEKLQNDIHALFPGKSRVRGWLWFTEADVTAGTAKEYESKDEAIFANRDPQTIQNSWNTMGSGGLKSGLTRDIRDSVAKTKR